MRRAITPVKEVEVIAEEEVALFVERGAVTIDTPLDAEQVKAAAASIEALLPLVPAVPGQAARYRYSATCNYFEAALLDLIQDPFFEEVAQRVLSAEAVRFFQTAILATYPQPGAEFSYDQHIDLQYTFSDLQATPRRVVCTFFLWLTDVNERRAPMMYRPGSHQLLAQEWQKRAELKGEIPRVIGIPQSDLPALDYAEPQPLLAKAGQVTVLSTAMVHGASLNVDVVPRKALVMTFTASGVCVDLPTAQQETKDRYDAELRKLLRPERVHLLSD
jgi:hypothetical protein